jgi:hypothetical protein
MIPSFKIIKAGLEVTPSTVKEPLPVVRPASAQREEAAAAEPTGPGVDNFKPLPMHPPSAEQLQSLKYMMQSVTEFATDIGVRVEITSRSRKPFAMGHLAYHYEIVAKRGKTY